MTTKKNGKGKLANFHGRKAAPFRKGHKPRTSGSVHRRSTNSTGKRKG